ncbi:hypothetical protein L7F22_041321 [Adiantum nelumboides]|nr:hypothetical protein [Adiantum nelumboides]
MELHPLSRFEKFPNADGTFLCNLCWESGCGPVYLCLHCNMKIHAACAASTKQQTHFSHHQHPLLLHYYGNRFPQYCGSCGLVIQSWCFVCETCNFYIHCLCVKAPRFIIHHSHIHPLEISKYSIIDLHRCNACMDLLTDLAYKCTVCKYGLHQHCATFFPIIKEHPKHPNHSLQLSYQPLDQRSFVCSECNEERRGWQFHCDTCNYSMDAQCANFLHQIEHTNHLASNAAASSDSLVISSNDLNAAERVLRFAREITNRADQDKEDVCCSICFEKGDFGKQKKITSCGHNFHEVCLHKWMENKQTCPICRYDLSVAM